MAITPFGQSSRNVAMIAPVRKILCLMLILLFGLVAGFAPAHATAKELHQLEHVGQSLGAPNAVEADHEEHCGLSQCGQVLGIAITSDEASTPIERALLAASVRKFMSVPVPDDIERPKWALSTTAVASL